MFIAPSALISLIEEKRVREEWIKSLPEDEQNEIRYADKKEYEERIKHKRELEIANALRPRNFWGK